MREFGDCCIGAMALDGLRKGFRRAQIGDRWTCPHCAKRFVVVASDDRTEHPDGVWQREEAT